MDEQNRLIFHIDVNSAFLSWESAKRVKEGKGQQDLRQIAAVIGGSEEERHGIVLAKSTKAKQYGIKTGEPLAQARRKCPSLVIAPPDFPLYVEMSRKFIELLRRYAPVVEQYSIDEAFCDMSGTKALYGEPKDFAFRLKQQIYEELGFTVNIGISTNKLLAKMASEFEKPDKVHTLFPNEIVGRLWPLPVNELFFVGPSTTRKLKDLGIRTIGELAETDQTFLTTHFKKHGSVIWNYANGFDSSPVVKEDPDNKGYSNSLTIQFDVTERDTACRILLSLCETIGTRLRKDGFYISVVAISIVDSEFHSSSRQMTLSDSTNITERIYQEACVLFDHCWNHNPIRQLGVSTSHAVHSAYEQIHLFDSKKYDKLSRLNFAIDHIRSRYGEDAVQRACFIGSEHTHMTQGMSRAKRL